MESKYKDRDYLKEYDLDFEIFEKFNLEINDVIPVRKVFVAVAEEGDYILKKVDYSREEIYFIKYIIDSLKKNGFHRVFDYVKAKDESIYIEHNGGTYTMMEYVQGRECQCSNPLDIEVAARGIAELHIGGRNISVQDPKRNNVGKFILALKRKREDIINIKNQVGAYRKKRIFDEMFMENVDYYLSQMDESISNLEKGSYRELCKEERYITVCHHDLAHHNILINEDMAYFVDFDYAIRDLKIHDISNFMNKVMKEHFYDMDMAKMILDEYTKINTIDDREFEVLRNILLFPEDFYSISAAYYLRHKNWDEITFIKRFEKKAHFREDRENFLKKL